MPGKNIKPSHPTALLFASDPLCQILRNTNRKVARADRGLCFGRLDQSRGEGDNEPHYFLSLLATKNDYRGHGFGMALLKEGRAIIDAENMPAYLESSNPINNHRYESVGFIPITSFQAPNNGPTVTAMWREKSPIFE
jgi:GNAT superfamily N-acetyltransferase